MGSTITGMTMAKATQADLDAGMDLCNLLDALREGFMPDGIRLEEGESLFDHQSSIHLRALYHRLMELERRGSLFRVVFGMQTIMSNNLLDPSVDHLAVHPRLTTGFVVANAAGDRFRMWNQYGPGWTEDRDKALWFARRADAEAFCAEDEDAWKILPAVPRGA